MRRPSASMPLALELFLKDIVLTLRTLRKDRAFSIFAILLLAAGIGVASAVFTLLWQVVYAHLPVSQPERLFVLADQNNPAHRPIALSLPAYRFFAAQEGPQILASHTSLVNAETPAGSNHLEASFVSGNFFRELGVHPAIGRSLTNEENGVMLSWDFWQSEYAGQPTAWNTYLHVNGVAFRVVGVTPAGFKGLTAGYSPKLYLPAAAFGAVHPELQANSNWSFRTFNIFVRVPVGMTPQMAEAQIRVAYRDLMRQQAAHMPAGQRAQLERQQITLRPASRGLLTMVEQWQNPLRLLQWMTGAVLLLAALNVAGLLVVRSVKYRRQMLIRYAIGASRASVVRLQLLETLVLAMAAGFIAFFLAEWSARGLVHLAGLDRYGAFHYSVRGWTLVAHAAAATTAALLTAMVPAWQASRLNLSQGLNEGALTHSTGRPDVLTRRMLAAGQISFSLVLAVAAGVFALSFYRLTSVPVGFTPQHVTTFSIDAHQPDITADAARLLWSNIGRRLNATPGVEKASYGAGGPFPQEVEATQIAAGFSAPIVAMTDLVGPAFFTTLRIPLVAGREINANDRKNAPAVVMLNESLAHRLFGNKNAIGQSVTLNLSAKDRRVATVVGVVADYRLSWRRGASPVLYAPAQQSDSIANINYYVRTAAASMDEATIRRLVRAEARGVPPFDIATMETRMAGFASSERALAFLIGAFAALALAIAAVGIYGVISYGASVRLNEFAVRASLGAMPRDLTWLVMKEALAIFIAGLALAIPIGWLGVAMLRHHLNGVTAPNSGIYGVAILLLALTTLTASAAPALRVTRMNVYRALRHS